MIRPAPLLLGLVLLAGCGDSGDGSTGDSAAKPPGTVAEEYLHAVADGDGDTACGHLVASEQKETVSVVKSAVPGYTGSDCAGAVAAIAEQFEDGGADKLRSAKAESVDTEGTTATVHFKGGVFDAELERHGDHWLITKGALRKTG